MLSLRLKQHTMFGAPTNRICLGLVAAICLIIASANFEVASAGSQITSSTNVAPNRTTLANPHHDILNNNAPSVTASASAHDGSPANETRNGKPYFIEFRARNAAQYGHTFVIYGRVGTRGTIAGFHPAGDKPDCENCSAISWMIGHIFPVPAETGASDGDNEPELYLTARYRIMLTAAEYKAVDAYIKYKQADKKMWHALFANCNQFAADIAEFIGLKTPGTWDPSRIFVERLTERNGGWLLRSPKLPDGAVRDAPLLLKIKTAS